MQVIASLMILGVSTATHDIEFRNDDCSLKFTAMSVETEDLRVTFSGLPLSLRSACINSSESVEFDETFPNTHRARTLMVDDCRFG